MAYKVIQAASLIVMLMLLVGTPSTAAVPTPSQDQEYLPVLSTFREVYYNDFRNPDGSYVFSFSLPQQERSEQRDAEGKVTGSFAFVDRYGKEVFVRFTADEEGYRPVSDTLPQIQQNTEEVASARERFLKYYELRSKLLEELASNEQESSEESDEDDDEDSDEDDDEDSDEDIYDLSSEEDSYSYEDDDDKKRRRR